MSGYASIQAMNWSTLKHMCVSAHAFMHNLKRPEKETPARFIGSALHCAILEPERFADTYAIMPDFGDLRAVEGRTTKEEGKANKLRKLEWQEKNAGKIHLDAEEAERISVMSAAVRSHRAAVAAIRGATEQVVTWTDPATGIACKGRLDVIQDGVVDVKTATDVSPRGFGTAAARYLYHGQAAFYHDGLIFSGRANPRRLPLFLAIQNRAPWDVAVYAMSSEQVEAGRLLYQRLLRRYADCTAANWWPGVAPEIQPLQLPAWAVNAETPPSEEDF